MAPLTHLTPSTSGCVTAENTSHKGKYFQQPSNKRNKPSESKSKARVLQEEHVYKGLCTGSWVLPWSFLAVRDIHISTSKRAKSKETCYRLTWSPHFLWTPQWCPSRAGSAASSASSTRKAWAWCSRHRRPPRTSAPWPCPPPARLRDGHPLVTASPRTPRPT